MADAIDSKSISLTGVSVQVRPSVPTRMRAKFLQSSMASHWCHIVLCVVFIFQKNKSKHTCHTESPITLFRKRATEVRKDPNLAESIPDVQ